MITPLVSFNIIKRITSIAINNFRGYYGKYDVIELTQGQNLLIYGENGSGKSSLFKALNDYFSSSRNTSVSYVKNRHDTMNDGQIRLSFGEFDSNFKKLPIPNQLFQFGSLLSNHKIPFIQNAALTKGFLDYTDLLNVYLHDEEEPNLFKLIVLKLLGNHIPISSGGNFRFGERWIKLQRNLTKDAYTRNDRCHRDALDELPIFQAHLTNTLNEVFVELNRLLTSYFPDLKIRLSFNLKDLEFNYGTKRNWHTTADLRLKITKDEILITGNYRDYLNEARLSAFAICLYLASLKKNPSNLELKILYLDDVFVGLDAGNRLPILSILLEEFSDYQIFISTYDRHWFELANRFFEINRPNKWITVEMYVGSDHVNNNEITKPIIIVGETNYQKAVGFLHNRTKPDYPAAANYFRKALEQLITDYLPKWELADSDFVQIPAFQLTTLVHRTRDFLNRSGTDTTSITKIISLLHALLHPLSHFEISSPIYKAELILIEGNYSRLKELLIDMQISENYRCCLEQGTRIRMTIAIDSTSNHFAYYDLIIKDSITIQYVAESTPIMCSCRCYTERCSGVNGTKQYVTFNPKKTDPTFNYDSLEIAYNKVHEYLCSVYTPFPKLLNYIDSMEYHEGINWVPLSARIVWE
ncbi:hypothetical protein ADIARSV_3012 [Arcticibacter svalbardensis MN12-7]|uniref:RecF/RecN/SMC N-terminal domain-containing protein n=1 Tax=Arcticibacter svalbardensis MN12-7 TaxID=1150600 RepID=R9GQQ0_9SPHI|nr:AAA family ATPase [Arcticibacter svalbardensis]EOR93875.1 hypothetical protein ADIARSV_3012 [Arcticibacter svalbardensis MN12-7]